MSDQIEKPAQQQSTETVIPAAEKPAETPAQGKAQDGSRTAGAAVSAAAKLFGRFNNLDGEPKKKDGEKPAEPAPGEKKESAKHAAKEKEEKPADAEEPVNPIFGKKKNKKQEALEIKDAIVEGNRELVQAVTQASAKPASEPAPKAEVTLSKPDAKLHEQLKKLEEINPSYKDVSSKFIEFKKKEAAYEAEWQAKNPDDEFDPDAQEHQKFYQKNEPHIDEDDLEAAREALSDERVAQRVREATEKELSPIKESKRHQEIVERLAPKLNKTFEKVARDAASQISPELGSIKDLSKVAEADPLAAQILGGVANHWLPVIQTAEFAYSGAKFDPNSEEGVRLGEVVQAIESDYSSIPKDERIKDGKRFATLADYSKMTAAERARHWHVGAEEVTEYASYRMKVDAKKFYQDETDRLEKFAASRGYVRNSGQGGKPAQPKDGEETTGDSGFKPAPAIGGASSTPAPTALRQDPDANPRTRVGKRLGWV